MSVPMTPERLAEYAALEQAATKGPWHNWTEKYPHLVLQGETGTLPHEMDGLISVNLAVDEHADGAFIAAARTAVPELLAEVARLTAERDELAHELDGVSLSLWEEEQASARLRLAHRSARERAAAYGEGILRVVGDRELYQGWLKKAEAECDQLKKRVAELETVRPSRADLLREAADALEARVTDVDVDVRKTWAAMDADYLRSMATVAEQDA